MFLYCVHLTQYSLLVQNVLTVAKSMKTFIYHKCDRRQYIHKYTNKYNLQRNTAKYEIVNKEQLNDIAANGTFIKELTSDV